MIPYATAKAFAEAMAMEKAKAARGRHRVFGCNSNLRVLLHIQPAAGWQIIFVLPLISSGAIHIKALWAINMPSFYIFRK